MAHLACVTGGTGYVATELVKQLLEKGYRVRATVRDAGDAAKVGALLRLGEALPGSLELVEADLLTPGSFDAAVAGCAFLFHCASPFFIDAADPRAQLVEPAVTGTRNVLAAAAKARATLRRVVLTSSCAAVKGMKAAPPRSGSTYSEEDWNETSTVEGGEAYWVGKTEAERLAWEVAGASGLELVTILPEFIMGPLTSGRTDGTSVAYMKAWVEGGAQSGAPVFADVRDVARAHVLAAETPSASGRYIVANSHSTPASKISAALQERFPQFAFGAGEKEESKHVIDNSRAQRELGLHLTPVRSTLVDMAVTMLQLGLATPKPAAGS